MVVLGIALFRVESLVSEIVRGAGGGYKVQAAEVSLYTSSGKDGLVDGNRFGSV